MRKVLSEKEVIKIIEEKLPELIEVEVDIVIKDDKHFLIEIKSSVSDADVLKFKKIGELYEKKTGVKPELIIISPYIREEGKKECEFLGIKYYEKER